MTVSIVEPFISPVETRTFYDTFNDPAGTDPIRRNVQFRQIPGKGIVPTGWRQIAGLQMLTNGSGGAYFTGINLTTNALGACLLGPAGTAGSRRVTLVVNAPSLTRMGTVIASDGRYFITAEFYDVGGNVIRIRQGDMHAAAPTYASAGNSLATLSTSATIGAWNAASDNTLICELVGNVVTVTHLETGVQVSATVTVPIGPESGLLQTSSINTAAVFKSISFELMAPPSTADMGNGIERVDIRPVFYMGQADGIDLLDRNGDGLPDMVIADAFNNNQYPAGIYTADQGQNDTWTLTPVNINSTPSVADKWTKAQGGVCHPTSNYRYFLVHDQQATFAQWVVDLHTGDRLLLSTYENGQDTRRLTLNGEVCIIATFEGQGSVTGIANGGIVGYRYLGGDPMLLASWQQFTIALIPGAWALQKTDFDLVDLNGDGQLWLVCGARYSGRNGDAVPGLYAVPVPADPFGGAWPGLTQLYAAGAGADFLNWDFGDFSGDGNGLDVVYAVLSAGAALPSYLRKSAGFTPVATLASALGLSSSNELWNVGRMPVRGVGGRDSFWCDVGMQGFYHIYFSGTWIAKLYHGVSYDHPSERPLTPVWDRPDGTKSVYHANTNGMNLLEQRFASTTGF